jgi:hypothetical protein
MPNNRSNDRDDWSRNDNSRNEYHASSRDDYTRQDNDSMGQNSRSGRGGSWSNRDDNNRNDSEWPNSRSAGGRHTGDSELYRRMEQGGSHTSAYGDEQSLSRDRYRNNPDRGPRENDRYMNARGNADMGADSWGGGADRDTGRDRYSSDRQEEREDYYGNRSVRDEDYDERSSRGFGAGDRENYNDRSYRATQQHDFSDSNRNSGQNWQGGSTSGRYANNQSNRSMSSQGQQNPQNNQSSRYNTRSGYDSSNQYADRSYPQNDDWGSDYGRGRGSSSMRNSGPGMGPTTGRNTGDRYSGREGGSNQFSSWRNDPSDMRADSGYGTPSNQQWGSHGGMERGQYAGGQHAGRGPKGYRRDDARITEDVNERLTHDAHIDASEIEVSVSNGEVTLTGTVDSRDAKHHAEDIVEGISGVSEVNNQIKVAKQAASNLSSRHASQADGDSTSTTGASMSSHTENAKPEKGEKHADKSSTKHASGGSAAEHAMSTAAGNGPSGAANTSVSSVNPSGKPSPNTSGASTQKMQDRGQG